jgi:hypothetical protein
MPSQATLPSQNDVWGISPLRVESELTAQKLESWRPSSVTRRLIPRKQTFAASGIIPTWKR